MTTPPSPADVLDAASPPIQPAATPEQAALLDWAAANPLERATIPKDGNGRYKAAPPDGGKAKGHTRVTTFAEALDDGAGLTVWRHRLLAQGITATDELVAAIRTAGDDKAQLSRHIAAALHLAGEKLAADVGSAIHLAMEHAVMGTGQRPPAPYDADVDAALAAMDAYGITPQPDEVERVAYVPDYGLIGTADLVASGTWGDLRRIVDYKTGSGHERISYAVQLPCYANASHLWRLDGEGWEPAPDIDREVGLIVHIPAGTATARVVEVDLAKGWELAALAAKVRETRSAPSVRSLFTVAATTTAPATAEVGEYAERDLPAGERTEWLLGLLRTITDPADRALLARRWPDGVATKPPWTDAEVDALAPIAGALAPTLTGNDPALPEPVAAIPADPAPPAMWTIDDDGTPPSPADEAAIVAAVAALTAPQRAVLLGWARDGRTAQREWAGGTDKRTARTVAIQAAACAAVAAYWDDDDPDMLTRLVLAAVIGEDLQPAWRTGAVLGALTVAQAHQLHQYADAFAASEPSAVAHHGALVTAALAAV